MRLIEIMYKNCEFFEYGELLKLNIFSVRLQ